VKALIGNDATCRKSSNRVLPESVPREAAERFTLTGSCLDLRATGKGAKPISDALRHRGSSV